MRLRYFGFGLRIDSEMLLPGARELAPSEPGYGLAADLTIVLGRVDFGQVQGGLGPYRLSADGLALKVPGVACYGCGLEGTVLTVDAAPGAEIGEVTGMLLSSALPAVLWVRGEMVLHAATAVLPGAGKAIAFCAASGGGKSTMLRQLLGAGSRVVGDDTLCLRGAPGSGFEGSGLPACTWLRGAAGVDGTGEEDARIALPVGWEQQLNSAKLGMICVLMPGAAGTLTRIRGVEALEALLNNLHRPLVPRVLGVMGGILRRMAEVAGSVPVYLYSPSSSGVTQSLTGDFPGLCGSGVVGNDEDARALLDGSGVGT